MGTCIDSYFCKYLPISFMFIISSVMYVFINNPYIINELNLSDLRNISNMYYVARVRYDYIEAVSEVITKCNLTINDVKIDHYSIIFPCNNTKFINNIISNDNANAEDMNIMSWQLLYFDVFVITIGIFVSIFVHYLKRYSQNKLI